MAKSKKKRNKAYTGVDASLPPTITKVTAVSRSPFGQWWFEHKKVVKRVATIVLIIAAVVIIIIEIVNVAHGGTI